MPISSPTHSSAYDAVVRCPFQHLPSPRTRNERSSSSVVRAGASAEGPSCLFVGPIDKASKEMLEALYHQARDSYYSGRPLIVDDMFDKVELKLRLYGSKSVIKYPRCSLMRQSTYSDAEEDFSQVLALALVWILLLALGCSAFVIPTVLVLSLSLEDGINLRLLSGNKYPFDMLAMLSSPLSIGIGYSICYPIVSASVQALKGLWLKNLVALKGSCPNCGEEVFAFAKTENSILVPHGSQCHVCESQLEFRGKLEQSVSKPAHRWVHGRVYLVPRGYPTRGP